MRVWGRATAAAIAALVLLVSGALILGVGIPAWNPPALPPQGTLLADADHPAVDEYSDWLAWARKLGFEGPAAETIVPAQAGIAALADKELIALNEAIRFGRRGYDRQQASADGLTRNSAMALASWLFAAADSAQVDRLHTLVPLLEPGPTPGSSWQRMTVALTGPPQLRDIHQGAADDCWLLAAMGAIAVANAATLVDRMHANDNGTYTVRWFIAGEHHQVTVSPYFPVRPSGELAYAHGVEPDEANWASVFEKAYAALPGFGSYSQLAGGSMLADSTTTVAAAMASVTGEQATTQPARDVTAAQLSEALAEGRPVAATTFLTGLAPAARDGEVPLVDRHVYIVETAHDGEVVMHNPWGYATAFAGPPTVRISIEDFKRRILLVTFGAL